MNFTKSKSRKLSENDFDRIEKLLVKMQVSRANYVMNLLRGGGDITAVLAEQEEKLVGILLLTNAGDEDFKSEEFSADYSILGTIVEQRYLRLGVTYEMIKIALKGLNGSVQCESWAVGPNARLSSALIHNGFRLVAVEKDYGCKQPTMFCKHCVNYVNSVCTVNICDNHVYFKEGNKNYI